MTQNSQRAGEAHTLDRETFGRRLRSARKKYGWTLSDVAQRSGVSVPTISRAERGQLALSYEKFSALARALKMDMSDMFSDANAQGTDLQGPIVTRAGKGVAYRGLAFTYEFLATQATGKQMSPILGTVHARALNGPEDFARHEGEEFVYVLNGSLDVHFETGEVMRLARGDSLYFDSRIGHAYVSTSRQLARTIGATTSESSQMRFARESEGHAAPAAPPAAPPKPAKPRAKPAASGRNRR
ncbi:MAG: XRE family transcriptional regulator [Pseudomonadota bacterium]